MVKISDIRFFPVNRKGSLVGFTSFTYDDCIAIKDVAVHQRLDKKGYRLVYPANEKAGRSIVFPVKLEVTKAIEKCVQDYMNNNGYIKIGPR